jgi:hypothetical protein
MPIPVVCPSCGVKAFAPDGFKGFHVHCPTCQSLIPIEAPLPYDLPRKPQRQPVAELDDIATLIPTAELVPPPPPIPRPDRRQQPRDGVDVFGHRVPLLIFLAAVLAPVAFLMVCAGALVLFLAPGGGAKPAADETTILGTWLSTREAGAGMVILPDGGWGATGADGRSLLGKWVETAPGHIQVTTVDDPASAVAGGRSLDFTYRFNGPLLVITYMTTGKSETFKRKPGSKIPEK